MALVDRSIDRESEPHPKFAGVKISKLAGDFTQSPIGVSILEIEPDTEIPVHVHDQNLDSIFILEGTCQVFVQGTWQEMGEGDFILVPPGEEHGVRNGSDPLKLYIVHHPPLF